MKKILLLLVLLPLFSFGQKVKSESGEEIGDLKSFTGKYCIIGVSLGMSNIVTIHADDFTFNFIDEEGKKMKFKTLTSVLNYMDKNGWDYTSVYVDTLKYFVFRKKES